MEDKFPPTTVDECFDDDFTQLLRDHQERTDDFLTTQRERLSQLEAEITQHLNAVVQQLAEEQADAASRGATHDEITWFRDASENLTRLHAQLVAEQAEWSDKQKHFAAEQQEIARRERSEIAARRLEVEAAETDLQQVMCALTLAQQQHAADVSQFGQSRRELERLRRELEQERDRLAEERAKTRMQRKGIARQLKAERSEMLAELAVRRVELDRESDRLQRHTQDLERKREECETKIRELDHRSADADADAVKRLADLEQTLHAACDERDDLHRRADADRRMLDETSARIEKQRAEMDQLRQQLKDVERQRDEAQRLADERQVAQAQLTDAPSASAAQVEELARLRVEHQELLASLAEAQGLLKSKTDAAQRASDQERRFEMAIADLRELKARNAELEEQLSQARRGAGAAVATGDDRNFDWESQKQRMLASLESDFDEQDEDDRTDRLTIEGTINITDGVVAHKDREIAELKQLLNDQATNLGSVAVGASAIAQMLDQDELVRQERQRLTEQQQEWREKLRQAEVETSLERAKLARERSLLEEKIQQLERGQANLADDRASDRNDKGKGKKPGGRRWLSRLGLRDTTEDSG